MRFRNFLVDTSDIAPGAVTTAALADGAVTEIKVASGAITVTKLGDGSVQSIKLAGTLQSDNYVTGASGWQIRRDNGNAEFNNVTVRGTIYATAGELGNLDVTGTLTMTGVGLIRTAASGARVEIATGTGTLTWFTAGGVAATTVNGSTGTLAVNVGTTGGFTVNAGGFNALEVAQNYARVQNGSAGAPAWSFVNDPDLGLYWVAANTLGISAAGSVFVVSGSYTASLGQSAWVMYGGADAPAGVVPGSTFGALMLGADSGHFVVQIRENDNADSFSVISGSGLVLNARADGHVRFPLGDIVGSVLRQDVATSALTIAGGNGATNGANIELYGGSHGSQANNAFYDANTHTFRTQGAGSNPTFTVQGWGTIWHAGNDGPGSGLNADLLDGSHASAFSLTSHGHEAGTSGAGPNMVRNTATTYRYNTSLLAHKSRVTTNVDYLADVELIPTKHYRRDDGRWRYGLIADWLAVQDPLLGEYDPDPAGRHSTRSGRLARYDSGAVVAVLAAKVARLEREVAELRATVAAA